MLASTSQIARPVARRASLAPAAIPGASLRLAKLSTSSVQRYASPFDQGGSHGHQGPPPAPQPEADPREPTSSVGSAAAGEQAAESSDARPERRRRRRGADASAVGLAAASLLPPLPLYKRILRAHRGLPLEMKSLGDGYVKDEFKRHSNIDNPLQIVGFLTQWKKYLDGLEQQQQGSSYRGQQLDVQQFEKLSDEQLYQLHELMQATRELHDPERMQAQPPGGQQAVTDAVNDAIQRARDDPSGDQGGNGGEGQSGR